MKNTLTIIISIAAVTMIGLSSEAMAQGRGPRGRGPGRCMAALDLTAQQRGQIDQLRDVAMKQSAPLRAQMRQKRDELRSLWRASQLDKNAITQAQAEVDAIRAKQREIWTDFRYQAHAVLTPEQQAKWAEHGCPGREGGRRFGHGRGGRGFGPGRGFGQGGYGGPDGMTPAQ